MENYDIVIDTESIDSQIICVSMHHSPLRQECDPFCVQVNSSTIHLRKVEAQDPVPRKLAQYHEFTDVHETTDVDPSCTPASGIIR